jgi:hypothetical protein
MITRTTEGSTVGHVSHLVFDQKLPLRFSKVRYLSVFHS